jgi:hypothetical protein
MAGTSNKATILVIVCDNMVMMPAASTLFFVRLRAVYMGNTYIKTFFGCCWLAVLGFFVFESSNGLKRCLSVKNPAQCFPVHIDAYGYIALAIYDTLMYLAISWQLASLAPSDRWQDRLRSFVTGSRLSWLSKVLLQSGQLYYLYVSKPSC